MFGISVPALIIILVIVVLVLGPSKLPQIGSALGGAIRGFKKAAEEEPRPIEADQHKKTEA